MFIDTQVTEWQIALKGWEKQSLLKELVATHSADTEWQQLTEVKLNDQESSI